MPERSFAIFNYCLTTESSCDPNIAIELPIKDVTVNTDSATNRVCAFIETVVGKTATECSPFYKVDTTAPTCKVVMKDNVFGVEDIVEETSKLAAKPYSWISASTGFTSVIPTPATDGTSYTAWVKDNAGNVGTCSSMTCTAWTCNAKNTTGSCSTIINNTNKVDNCENLYTCSRAYSYRCPSGTSGNPTASSPYCYTSTSSSQQCSGSGYWYGDIGRRDEEYVKNCSKSSIRSSCGNCGKYYSKFCKGNYWVTNSCNCKWIDTTSCWTNYSCNSGTKINNSQCRHNASPYCETGYTNISSSCKKYNQTSCPSGETSTITSKNYEECSRTCTGA